MTDNREDQIFPTVSVVILTYNGAWCIEQCLKAVFGQDYPKIEVIVVDNASEDDTTARVAKFPAARLVSLGENTEYCRGNNLGISTSRGEYILVLNQDVRLMPDFVRELVQALEDDRDAGIATGKLLRCTPDFVPIMPPTIDNAGGHIMLRDRTIRERGHAEVDRGQYDDPAYVFSATGAAAFFRRAALDSIEYRGQFFDEAFVAYKEDVDISWRCRTLGWAVKFVPSAVGYHVRGWGGPVGSIASRRAVPALRRRHSFKNRYLLLAKNERPQAVLADLPWIVWHEVRSLGFCLFIEPHLLLTVPILISLIPDVLRKRRHVKQAWRIARHDSPSLFALAKNQPLRRGSE